MKNNKIIYWLSTGLMCLLFLFSAGMYLFNYPRAEMFFNSLGFPVWIIYPLAILKILAVLVILTKKVSFLKELAYAGFIFDAILALAAHTIANDGENVGALIGCILIIISWVYDRKVYGKYTQNLNITDS